MHVAVSGADRALAVYNALRSYLPELLALGANAPYYGGEDTGLATVRAKLNQSWARSGVPPAFASWRELAEFTVWARDGGALSEANQQWWDLRLAPAHGTIELRVADTQTRVDDAATLIALVQSLVADLANRHEAGEELPVHRDERIVENMWLATRDGIGGHLLDLDTGAKLWTADRLQDLAARLVPTATQLGCDRELAGIGRLVLDGGGAARQRGIVRRRGLESLLPKLAEETSGLTAEEAEERLLGHVPDTGADGTWQ